ncbi:MAG: hypothetical protein FGM23_03560 [Alphaproteobacteria bacterium]|nr:hypothetical protein [Alphaproteobacteria bacterium]
MEIDVFVETVRLGAVRVFNCREVTKQLKQKRKTEFAFKIPVLNECIIVKQPNFYEKTKENDIKNDEKLITKLYYPYEDNILNGGLTFEISKNSLERIVSVLCNNSKQYNDIIDYDENIIESFLDLPTVDPFILYENFKRKRIDIPEEYFNISKDEWLKIYDYVSKQFSPIIKFAYPDQKVVPNQLSKLVDLLWQGRLCDDTANIMKPLNVDINHIEEVLFSWKGIVYYSYIFKSNAQKAAQMTKWFSSVGNNNRYIQNSMQSKKCYFVSKIKRTTGDIKKNIDLYDEAYGNLFIKRKSPDQFINFLADSREIFWDMSAAVSEITTLYQIWHNFTAQHKNQKITPARLAYFFDLLEYNQL